jgi:rRNA maturation endonuclease Nob1
MTMTETDELTWMRVLYIEDSPIECDWDGCSFEAKWRHVCPACGMARVRCRKNHYVSDNQIDSDFDFVVRCHTGFGGCGTMFPVDLWNARYYPM